MKTNIVLIGMTGSGKSSVGKQLSKRLSMPFVDIDEYIEQISGQTIPELFEISEQHFRSIETQACRELAEQKQQTILSCGGGVVLNQENIEALTETGWIVFIDRPVDHIIQDIQTAHRPLLRDGKNKLYQLYDERIDLYTVSADFIVENTSTIDSVLAQIEQHLPETIYLQKGENK